MVTIADVPIDIGRDEARQAAERELARPEYAAASPSLLDRAVRWLWERFAELLHRATEVSPGGYGGLFALVVILVLAVIAVRLAMGRVGRVTRGRAALLDGTADTARDHRLAAAAHAERGEWALAVRERLRAVVRELEERDLLDAVAGRTAAEVAAEAGRVLPDLAEELRAAAHLFEDVWYGGAAAEPWMDDRLRATDDAVRRARPRLSSGAAR